MGSRKWNPIEDDPLAYNIKKVVYQEDFQTFFGVDDLPPPNAESSALSAQDFAAAKEPGTSQLLSLSYAYAIFDDGS